MSEVSDAFRRIEPPNVRTEGKLRCSPSIVRSAALRSHFFSGSNNNSIGLRSRRIRRQVAEACTDSLDRLFHAQQTLWNGTLSTTTMSLRLSVGTKRFCMLRPGRPLHSGSFDQHRSHDAGLPQPSDKRHGLPVSHRGIADQALAAWLPTVEPQHVGGDCRLVDKYEVGRIKKALLPNPASAPATSARFRSCRPQTFF